LGLGNVILAVVVQAVVLLASVIVNTYVPGPVAVYGFVAATFGAPLKET
jgi:hypothetical protein